MAILLDFLKFLKRPHHDHDEVDNLNTRLVCIFALAVGFLLFASEYGSNSIQCVPKATWRPSWKQYAEDLCFIEGSYFVDPNATLPHYSHLEKSKKVSSYQWAPFIFLFIALIFHLPRVFWSSISSTSYLRFKDVCESSMDFHSYNHSKSIARFEDVSLRNPSFLPAHFGFGFINRFFDRYIADRYMVVSYFFVKFWHIFNVVFALRLLCFLISDNLHDPFGYKTYWKILAGVNWRESGAFPRITTCEISTRQYASETFDKIKYEQFQCFLAANNYIEKIFLFTWIIFAALFFVNVWNLFSWIWKIWNSKVYAKRMIRARLQFKNNEEQVEEFLNFLSPDARFTILMIDAQNGGFVSGSDFTICYIHWEKSKESKKQFVGA
uniref:Innexin n=1 Tax=Panagrolaimus sp. ES5 TaxID=591445 RepID=A0AC34F474_9BILA